MPELSIIIPAYNEEATIAELLQKVLAVDFGEPVEVIAVDDGSKDRTLQVLHTFDGKIQTLALGKNSGKGAAVRAGFAVASGKYVVVQDADLEYEPTDLARMLTFAKAHDAPVVYGSRQLRQGNNQRGRFDFYAGGLLLTWLTNLLYGTHITDEPTCYKMMRSDVLKQFTLTANGFEFCPEITAKIAKRKIPIAEIGIAYYPRSTTEGKKIRAKDGIIAIWTLLKNRVL